MIQIAPQLTGVDIALVLSELWEISDSCLFIDNDEDGYLACSITCFNSHGRASLALVYTKSGGAARIFDGQMQLVGQTIEKLTQEDYHGFRNLMVKMDSTLPDPEGISKEDLLEGL